MFLVRILYGGVNLLERTIYLEADHHRAPKNVAIIVEIRDESMQMGFLSVDLAILIEFSRREYVS